MYRNNLFTTIEATAALKNLASIRWRQKDFQGAEELLAQALFALETSDQYGLEHEQTKNMREMLLRLRQGQPPPAPPSLPSSSSTTGRKKKVLKEASKPSDTALFAKKENKGE